MAGAPQPKPKPRAKNPKWKRDECDQLFSRIIRLRDKRCRACDVAFDLQCAHIVTRRRSPTRCDERNAIALCGDCHHVFTEAPEAWRAFVVQYVMTAGELQDLEALSMEGWAPDWTVIAAELRERLNTLEEQ